MSPKDMQSGLFGTAGGGFGELLQSRTRLASEQLWDSLSCAWSHDLYPSGLPETPRSDAGRGGAVVTGQGEGGMSVCAAGCVGGWPSPQPPASRGISSPLAPLIHLSPVLPLPALCEAGGLAVCSQLWPCALGRLEDAS